MEDKLTKKIPFGEVAFDKDAFLAQPSLASEVLLLGCAIALFPGAGVDVRAATVESSLYHGADSEDPVPPRDVAFLRGRLGGARCA